LGSTHLMAISRRQFLALSANLAGQIWITSAEASSSNIHFASCAKEGENHVLLLLDEKGQIVQKAPLPSRGHDVVFSSAGDQALVFARRPGIYLALWDFQNSDTPVFIKAAEGRHFYGHGCFSEDQRIIFATENVFNEERAVIGCYQLDKGQPVRIAEWDTGGIGAHEILLSNDGRSLIVANGGIATHPDFPRQKLNIPEMSPSLCYINPVNGHIEEQVFLQKSLHKLSLRHIAEDSQGRLWFGGQFQGEKKKDVPLIGWHKRGEKPVILDLPMIKNTILSGYVGSVAADPDRYSLAFTFPRDGKALILNENEPYTGIMISLSDICGVASASNGLSFTTGGGHFLNKKDDLNKLDQIAFDNHLAAL